MINKINVSSFWLLSRGRVSRGLPLDGGVHPFAITDITDKTYNIHIYINYLGRVIHRVTATDAQGYRIEATFQGAT